MRFHGEQRFAAPLHVVEAALLEPGFLARLAELPNVGRPELLDHHVDREVVYQRVRYRFTGALSPAVTTVVDPARLTWVDESAFDLRRHREEHRIVPDHYGGRLQSSYTTQLAPAGGGGHTVRHTDGDVRVRCPLVAGRVERAIVSGLREHAAVEAEVLARWLEEQG